MSFDSTGLTIKDVATILDEMNDEVLINLRSLTGDSTAVIDTSDISPIGRFNEIFANRLAEVWSTAKQVEEAMRVNTADGVSLEKLALLVGFVRNPATFTRGDLRFYGDNDTTIPQKSIFANIQGDQFTNPSDVLISLSNCLSFNTRVGVIKDNRQYSITIGKLVSTITSGSGATNLSILNQLKTAVDNQPEFNVTTQVLTDGTQDEDYFLEITYNIANEVMNASVSALLVTDTICVEGLVVSDTGGLVFATADTVNVIITSLNGLDSVNNTDDFILGTVRETSEELRTKISTDYNVVGSGTLNTIRAIIEKDVNVRSVYLDENRLETPNANNVPAKSYEVILSHEGTPAQMGKLVWDTRPTGIATYGDTPVVVKDASGDDQTIYYTEATDLFAYFRITGNTLPPAEGEVLPTDYKTIIQDACNVEGEAYEINQDVIGKRFYGTIYRNVPSIDELDVEVFLSPTLTDIGTIPNGSWQALWAVGREQIATFGNTDERFLINITTTV